MVTPTESSDKESGERELLTKMEKASPGLERADSKRNNISK